MGDVPLPLNAAVSLRKLDERIARVILFKKMVRYECVPTGTHSLVGSKAGFDLENAFACRKRFTEVIRKN